MADLIAVISDIHSNLPALKAVLADIEAAGAELIVNLGDSLLGPVDPAGTARLLMGYRDMIHIMGNCDELLLLPEHESASFRYVKPLLDASMEAWIASHKPVWRREGMLFCHGTPWHNADYLLEKVTKDGVSLKTGEQLERELHRITEKTVFCGHSHVFRSVRLADGTHIVNPGSVGLPAYEDELPYPHRMESGTPCASYCLVRGGNGKVPLIEHRLISYPWPSAANAAEHNGRPDYAVPIRTGRIG